MTRYSLMLALVFGIAWAQPPEGALSKPGELTKTQEANAKLFKDLSRKLLELAVKLDKSDRPEDKDRAKTIRSALELAEKAGIENQFRTLLSGMSSGGKQQDVERLIGQDEELTRTLIEMLTILNTDDETARLKMEIARLEKFLKEAEELKRRQELLRTLTDSKKGEAKSISDRQNDLANQTKDLAQRMGGGKSGQKKGPVPESKSDPKASDSKDGDKASDPKGDSEGKKSESKSGEPKDGSESKKGGEPKESPNAKPGEDKPGEPKPGEPKEPKEGSTPKDAGEGKGNSKPKDAQAGEGKSKGSTNGQSPPPGEPKSGGSPKQGGGESPTSPPPPPQNQTPGRKNVEEAYQHQKGAEDDSKKDDRNNASKKMDKAVEELAKAIEEMKKRLKQLREEEMMKLLANLEARCNRMLAMQIEVYNNTKAIHDGIIKNDNQKTNADIQKSQQQADKEKEIVAEAEKALKLLETEGSAVAFAKVLEEVMGDMIAVQQRLDKAVVGDDTQAIEQNIIAMLKDMVDALKKKQQEMQNQKNNPNPTQPNKPNQKLIDQLAELKLIRALQTQINARTVMYGKQSGGEQAAEPLVQNEIRQLAQRQAKIQDMIQKMATQANQ